MTKVDTSVLTDHARLRCNRHRPCQNCEVRNEVASCSYTKAPAANGTASGNSPRTNMQERIDRLENLVLEAMGNKSSSSQSPQSNPDNASAPKGIQDDTTKTEESLPTIGVLEIKDHRRSLYSGSTAWNGVLHEVSPSTVPRTRYFTLDSRLTQRRSMT